MTRDWKSLYKPCGENEVEGYSKTAIDHFTNPRNVGRIDEYHGQGSFGDPQCGDYMELTIRLDKDNICDIGFLVYGCAGAIATSSMVTEHVKGKSIGEALRLTDADVIRALGGIPQGKEHCSMLGLEALRLAIADALFGRRLIETGKITGYDEYREKRKAGEIRFEYQSVEKEEAPK